MTAATSAFALADGCKELLTAEGITVFVGPDGLERAVFLVDGNTDPLPGCDPNEYGYAIAMVNYIDQAEGMAVCEVIKISELLNLGRNLECAAKS